MQRKARAAHRKNLAGKRISHPGFRARDAKVPDRRPFQATADTPTPWPACWRLRPQQPVLSFQPCSCGLVPLTALASGQAGASASV